MRVCVAGSRTIGYREVVKAIEEAKIRFNIDEITEIVSGTARGPDRLGEGYAKMRGIPIKRFPADWNTYGNRAGMIRNKEMAHYADVVVTVWDGESRGTKGMIEYCKNGMIPVYVSEVGRGHPRLPFCPEALKQCLQK